MAASASFFLVIIESIKKGTAPSPMEIIALIFGIYGALVLVIPELFAKIFCFCCFKKLHPPEITDDEVDKVIDHNEHK
jgi:hypothetical protein